MSALPAAVIPTIAGTPSDLSTMDYTDAYRHDTAFMHNTIRAFNQIKVKVMQILPSEMADFASYVGAFCEALRRHCEGESTTILPRVSAHTSLNGQNNAVVLEYLGRIDQWVREAIQLPEKAGSTKLMAAMEAMTLVFSKNMHEQPNHMTPSAL